MADEDHEVGQFDDADEEIVATTENLKISDQVELSSQKEEQVEEEFIDDEDEDDDNDDFSDFDEEGKEVRGPNSQVKYNRTCLKRI